MPTRSDEEGNRAKETTMTATATATAPRRASRRSNASANGTSETNPGQKLSTGPAAAQSKPATTSQKSGTTLTVFLINGVFEVHKAGCREIARTQRSGRVNNRFNLDVGTGAGDIAPNEYAVTADLWSDIIRENVPENYPTEAAAVASYYESDTKFHGCTKKVLTPMGQGGALTPPGTRTKAEGTPAKDDEASTEPVASDEGSGNRETPKVTAKQVAKRRLATAVVKAASEVLGDSVVMANLGMSEADAAKAISHWLHHLPANREEWPQSLPRPNRSDWR